MPKYILINKEGLYLGETQWVELASFARRFDAEEISVALLRHNGAFAWRIVEPTGGYEPERTRNRPEFRETCAMSAAA